MIRRPPRSTRKESSAASDVYKRQSGDIAKNIPHKTKTITNKLAIDALFMVFPPLKNTILMPLFLVKKSH